MNVNFSHLIENESAAGRDSTPYAAILGLTPSRGARSPTLWNAAFAKLGMPARMFPFDVTEAKLASLVSALKADPRFLGGAVTMPFKTQILPMLDEIEPEAKDAGAVNCVFKKNGKLFGTNTDGAAAALTLAEAYGKDLRGAKVFLVGLGGAGSAVAAYVGAAIGKDGQLTLANRSRAALEGVKGRVQARTQVKIHEAWPVKPVAEKFDVIINASSLGHEAPREDKSGWFMPKNFSPLGAGPGSVRCTSKEEAEKNYASIARAEIAANISESLAFLEKQSGAFVYDIVYQPRETLLMSLARLANCRVLNGLAMNLEQAVIAFDKASVSAGLRTSNLNEVRKFMEGA